MNILRNLLLAASFSAMIGVNAAPPLHYYDALDGLDSPRAIIEAVSALELEHLVIAPPASQYGSDISRQYTALRDYFMTTDVYPPWHYNHGYVWDMYSDDLHEKWDGNVFDREHSFPKSWWKNADGKVDYTTAYCDLYHMNPASKKPNNAKSDNPMGLVDVASFDNGVSKVGTPVAGYGGGSKKVFEPDDRYKGDFARAYMYIATVYYDLPWSESAPWMVSSDEPAVFHKWASDMLLYWGHKDVVSEKEYLRQANVIDIQSNRNAFIDIPLLAEYIWGAKANQVLRTKVPQLTQPTNDDLLHFGNVNPSSTVERKLLFSGIYHVDDIEVSISGDDADKFSVATSYVSADAVNSDEGTYLTITYSPNGAEGFHSATLDVKFASSFLNNSSPLFDGPEWVDVDGRYVEAEPAYGQNIWVSLSGKGDSTVMPDKVETVDRDQALINVRVYDVYGRLTAELPRIESIDDVVLPAGMYIVTATNIANPLKFAK